MQETVSGSGSSWAVYKSAPCSIQLTTLAPTNQFYRPHTLPAAQPTASKHWRHLALKVPCIVYTRSCNIATCWVVGTVSFWGVKKVKLAHTRLPSIGFRSWSRFLAVSLQVTWIINPAVGCHYFTSTPLLSVRLAVTLATLKRAATSFAAWWIQAQWVWTVCLWVLHDSVATTIWTWAFCPWVQHANHSATEPPCWGVEWFN